MAEPVRVTRLRESMWCPVEGLTQEQARTLEALGVELSATDSDTGDTTSLIQCRYTTAGVWEVRVAEAIGLVGVGDVSWPVDPKVPSDHLFYLLQRASVLPTSSTQSAQMAHGASFWELLYGWYLRSVEKLVRSDLAKGYTVEAQAPPSSEYLTSPTATLPNLRSGVKLNGGY